MAGHLPRLLVCTFAMIFLTVAAALADGDGAGGGDSCDPNDPNDPDCITWDSCQTSLDPNDPDCQTWDSCQVQPQNDQCLVHPEVAMGCTDEDGNLDLNECPAVESGDTGSELGTWTSGDDDL